MIDTFATSQGTFTIRPLFEGSSISTQTHTEDLVAFPSSVPVELAEETDIAPARRSNSVVSQDKALIKDIYGQWEGVYYEVDEKGNKIPGTELFGGYLDIKVAPDEKGVQIAYFQRDEETGKSIFLHDSPYLVETEFTPHDFTVLDAKAMYRVLHDINPTTQKLVTHHFIQVFKRPGAPVPPDSTYVQYISLELGLSKDANGETILRQDRYKTVDISVDDDGNVVLIPKDKPKHGVIEFRPIEEIPPSA